MRGLEHLIDISGPRSSAARPELLVSTSIPVLSLFGVTFLVSLGLVIWLMRLRVGVYELESLPIFFSLFLLLDYWPAILGLVVAAFGLLRPSAACRPAIGQCHRQPALRHVGDGVRPSRARRAVCLSCPSAFDGRVRAVLPESCVRGWRRGRELPSQVARRLVPPGFQNVFLVVSRETGQVRLGLHARFRVASDAIHGARRAVVTAIRPLARRRSWFCTVSPWSFSAIRGSAGLAILLAIASSAFSVNAMSFYSMTAHALANGLFALLLLRPTVWRCLIAGVVGLGQRWCFITLCRTRYSRCRG